MWPERLDFSWSLQTCFHTVECLWSFKNEWFVLKRIMTESFFSRSMKSSRRRQLWRIKSACGAHFNSFFNSTDLNGFLHRAFLLDRAFLRDRALLGLKWFNRFVLTVEEGRRRSAEKKCWEKVPRKSAEKKCQVNEDVWFFYCTRS